MSHLVLSVTMIFSNGRKIILIMSTTALVTGWSTGCGKGVNARDIRREYIQEEAIKNGAERISETVQDAANDARNTADDLADKGRQTADDLAGMADDGIRDARQAAGEFSEDTKTAAGDVAESTRQLAESAAEGAKDIARQQAEDSREDAGFLFDSIMDEWHGILDTLTSPWGIGQGLDGEGSSDVGSSEVSAYSTAATQTIEHRETGFDFSTLSGYSGTTCVPVNGNWPFFYEEDLTETPFEYYSPLDSMGRCGMAYANICRELMPTGERGDIGMIKPSGWKQNKYEGIISEDPPYLYNRCHLIAFSLAGENANPSNLITGTRHFNTETGMEAYELQVLSYVRRTGNHVLYRVTPYFKDDDLLATGVLMEARSVEDTGISVCVFVYNVQPGVAIDYRTGDNWAA